MKLAIIGAALGQLPICIKAKELGIETHCFAWPEGAVCKDVVDFFYPISILEKDAIVEKCKNLGVDGVGPYFPAHPSFFSLGHAF